MIVTLVNFMVEVLVWLIVIRCFLSFIPHNPYHPVFRFIYDMTDPILNFCGRFLPDSLKAPLDFTPWVALIGLQMLVLPLLMRLAAAIFY